MFLRGLSVSNFKNYEQQAVELTEKFVCITGKNGAGKTNLLDAVHYLCLCKSGRASSDKLNVRHGQDYFRLEGQIERISEPYHIEVKLRARGGERRKTVSCNGEVYERLADHIGRFPLVMVSPDDAPLIEAYSDERRRFMDSGLSQTDHTYLETLIQYNRLLSQRNALLKNLTTGQQPDLLLLESIDRPMTKAAAGLFDRRSAFVEQLSPIFIRFYELLSGGSEVSSLNYRSGLLNDSMADGLQANLQRDCILGRTSFGPHRDDITFITDEYAVKKTGSQGQKKSFLLALKLALWSWMSTHNETVPLLLLDDIFDRLDQQRVTALFALLHELPVRQVLLTDTNAVRTASVFAELDVSHQLIAVRDGRIV